MMGTRHLICVFADGQYKVAQYGQWDGYPGGQGVSVLEFISDENNIQKLRQALPGVRFFDARDKEFIEAYETNAAKWSNEPDERTSEQIRWFAKYITRDLGADILFNIASSHDEEILLKNELEFAGDSLFCEYCYVVDLDTMRFEVYEGFNKSPLAETDRFYGLPRTNVKYHPVKKVAEWSILNLPTEQEFIEYFVEDDEPITAQGQVNNDNKTQSSRT